MAGPGLTAQDVIFDDPDDPELRELMGVKERAPAAAEPPADNSDLFDPEPPAAADPELAKHPGAATVAAPSTPAEREQMDRETQLVEENRQLRADLEQEQGRSLWDRAKSAFGNAKDAVVQGYHSLDRSLGEKIAKPLDEFGQSAADAVAGIGQGVTFGWGDELAAAMTPEIDDGTGIPREYAAGSAYKDLRNNIREGLREAQENSPWLYGTGQVIGSAAPMVLTGGGAGAAEGAGLGARALQAAQQGFNYGMVSGAGGSESDDIADVAGDALESGMYGAGGGLLTTGIAGGAQKLGQWAAPKLKALGETFRAGAAGGYGGEMAKLAEKYGPEYVQTLGQAIERLKLHERPGALGTRLGSAAAGGALGAAYGGYTSDAPDLEGKLLDAAKYGLGGAALGAATKGLPSTPSVYLENANRVAKEAGSALGGAIDDATAQGVTFPREELLSRMRTVLRQTGRRTEEGRALRDKIRGLMQDVRGSFDENVNPSQLQALKQEYKEAGGYVPTKNLPTSDARSAQMYRKLANAVRSGIKESIAGSPATAGREAVEGLALPETAEQFVNANRDYGIAKTVGNMARKRVAQEAGNQPLSLMTAAAAPAGPVAAASFEGMKRVGKDVLADVAGDLSRVAGAVGRPAASAIVEEAPAVAGTATGTKVASLFGDPYPVAAAAQDNEQAKGPPGGWRDAVVRALQNDTAALGSYAQPLSEAAASKDPGAVDRLVARYQGEGGGDTFFRTKVFPMLQRLAAEGDR